MATAKFVEMLKVCKKYVACNDADVKRESRLYSKTIEFNFRTKFMTKEPFCLSKYTGCG